MLSSRYQIDKHYSQAPQAMAYGVRMPEVARPKQNTFEQLSIGQGQQ